MEDVMRKRTTTILLAFACAATLPGCDDSGEASSVLEARVVTVEAVKTVADVSTSPVEGATLIKFTVTGPGMDPVSTSYSFLAGGGDLPVFPQGENRQLTVEICTKTCDPSEGGDIISRGRSVPRKLEKGDDKKESVFVAPRNAFVPPTLFGGTGAELSTMGNKDRVGASVTTLDDGRLLIVGGAKVKTGAPTWYRPEDLEEITASAEIFDPRTGTFSPVSPLNEGRAHHQAVKLTGAIKLKYKNQEDPSKDDEITVTGGVLVLGGFASDGGATKITNSIEVFNPATNSFVMEPEDRWLQGAGRALFTAALAYPAQNVVFLAGGQTDPGPVGGTWHLYKAGEGLIGAGALSPGEVGNVNAFGTPRWNHTMTFLPKYGEDTDGKAVGAFLLVGGENADGTLDAVEAYLVDPVETAGFSVRRDVASVAKLPLTGRSLHSAIFVERQGIVYVAGGFEEKGPAKPIKRIEVYRVGARGFKSDEYLEMAAPRGGASVTLTDVDHSAVFIAGGRDADGVTPRTEVLVETIECPATGCVRVPRVFSDQTPDMESPRAGQAAVLDATRRLFLVGGVDGNNLAPDPILYNPE